MNKVFLSVLVAVFLFSSFSLSFANPEAKLNGQIEFLKLDGHKDYTQWFEKNGWEDVIPFTNSANRFSISNGVLRMPSDDDHDLIGLTLKPEQIRSIKDFPFLRMVVRIDKVPEGAELKGEVRDDSAFRVYVLFQETPLEALVYIWSWKLPVGAWSDRSDSWMGDYRGVRRKVFGQGKPLAGQWLTVETNLLKDFRAQWPDSTKFKVIAFALKADTNSTKDQTSLSFIRSLSLHKTSLKTQGLKEGAKLGDTTLWFR